MAEINNKILKAVIFDLDDTLFDHRHSMRTGLAALQKKYECFSRLTLDEFEHVHLRLMNEIHLNQVLAGGLSLDEARELRFKSAFKMFGIDVNTEEAAYAAGIYRENYLNVTRLKPGAYKLLEKIKKLYKVGIVTNNLVDEQKRKLEVCKINHLVDIMVTSEEAGVTKPHIKIFEILLNKLHCSPQEAVMIGDSWEVDILPAFNIGMKCIWMNTYNEKRETDRIAVEINSFIDLQYIISLIKQ